MLFPGQQLFFTAFIPTVVNRNITGVVFIQFLGHFPHRVSGRTEDDRRVHTMFTKIFPGQAQLLLTRWGEAFQEMKIAAIQILLQHLAVLHPQQLGDLLPILRWSRGRHCQDRGA